MKKRSFLDKIKHFLGLKEKTIPMEIYDENNNLVKVIQVPKFTIKAKKNKEHGYKIPQQKIEIPSYIVEDIQHVLKSKKTKKNN